MKKQTRMVKASDDVAALVDQGAAVKVELDNLTYRDKALKVEIGKKAADEMQEGELALRLAGVRHAALVSSVENCVVDCSSDDYWKVMAAIDSGLLEGVASVKRELKVSPDNAKRAAEILLAAGIEATVVETVVVSPDGMREMGNSSSPKEKAAQDALRKCVRKEVSQRVKYEAIDA